MMAHSGFERVNVSFASLQTALLVPPVNLLLAIGAGLALMRASRPAARRLGGWLATLGFLALVAFSLPATAWLLLTTLERGQAPDAREGAQTGPAPGAIVVLSAEDLRAVPGGIIAPPDIGALTLQRLRAGALLHRRTGLPVLVSGGVVRPGTPPIARAMARVLANDYGITASWVEDGSATTWQNAGLSVPLLRRDGVEAAYIVTHGWHMRRARLAFDRAGLPTLPMPTHLTGPATLDAAALVPSAHAWSESRHAMHEWIGLAWYALRPGG
jgi:uncharacterized SAM-binding protein YcdF (DUF218 family)